MFKCPLCGKGFKTENILLGLHMPTHARCPVCSQKILTADMVKHIKTEHPTETQKYVLKCPCCKKVLAGSGSDLFYKKMVDHFEKTHAIIPGKTNLSNKQIWMKIIADHGACRKSGGGAASASSRQKQTAQSLLSLGKRPRTTQVQQAAARSLLSLGKQDQQAAQSLLSLRKRPSSQKAKSR